VFHAATRRVDDSWMTASGRVLAVVGRGADLATARAHAERAADRIAWPGMQRRHDIGLDDAGERAAEQPVGAAR